MYDEEANEDTDNSRDLQYRWHAAMRGYIRICHVVCCERGYVGGRPGSGINSRYHSPFALITGGYSDTNPVINLLASDAVRWTCHARGLPRRLRGEL